MKRESVIDNWLWLGGMVLILVLAGLYINYPIFYQPVQAGSAELSGLAAPSISREGRAAAQITADIGRDKLEASGFSPNASVTFTLIEKVGKGIKSMVKGRKSGSESGQGRGLFSKIFDSALREVDEWAGVPEERARREQVRQPDPPAQGKNVEEERLMILKMLENGAISVDEATARLKKL